MRADEGNIASSLVRICPPLSSWLEENGVLSLCAYTDVESLAKLSLEVAQISIERV